MRRNGPDRDDATGAPTTRPRAERREDDQDGEGAVTGLAEPVGTHDFTFDRRPLVNPRTRELAVGAEHVMPDALTGFPTRHETDLPGAGSGFVV